MEPSAWDRHGPELRRHGVNAVDSLRSMMRIVDDHDLYDYGSQEVARTAYAVIAELSSWRHRL